MKPSQGNQINMFQWLCRFAAGALLAGVFAPFILAQQKPPAAHPPAAVMMKVSSVLVPNLRGQRSGDAEATLEKAGLRLGTVSQSPGPGAVGTVWNQEPKQAAKVPYGSSVNVALVSRGPDANSDGDEDNSTQVPPLEGRTSNQASNLLDRYHLRLGNVIAGDVKGVQGTIYTQKPAAKSWVKVGTTIDVGIVEPPKTSGQENPSATLVPNLYGQTEKGADEILVEVGLRMGSVLRGHAAVQPETIFAQQPTFNARVRPGTPVNIQIAEPEPAPELVVVPSVLERDVTSAGSILQKFRLRLGEIGSEESEENVNLISAQSPVADTRVAPGTSVNVTVAREPLLVFVPDVRQAEEQSAVAALDAVGLQLGTASDRESEADTGTILAQDPAPGSQVRKGTSVNVVLSRQLMPTLTVMTDNPDPRVGKTVNFHALIEPAEKGFQYQFDFGDGTQSGLLTTPTTPHSYSKAGPYRVRATAVLGAKSIQSGDVTVDAHGIPPVVWVVLAAGIIGFGASAFVFHGWRLFRKWVRVVPNADIGQQELKINSRAGWNENVRLRLGHPAGDYEVEWRAGQEPRKAETS